MRSSADTAVARTPWKNTLQRSWLTRGPLATLLWPVSLLYRALIALRRQFYRWGVFKVHQVDALVLVVGNVITGGAGKTPTAIAIVQHLTQNHLAVGVISRGYGRSSRACREVHAHDLPHDVGDEPLLLKRATQVPVFVGTTRLEAAQALLAQYPQTQIIVCDDGLQHYALHRDLEICVFDDRGCGNHWLLPAGPLRETWPRQTVGKAGQHNGRLLVLHTGSRAAFAGFRAQRSLGLHGQRRDGSTVALSALTTRPASNGSLPLLAVAGIAQPDNFFSMLRGLHLPLQQTLALPDHYDFDSFSRSIYKGYQLICTEKDAAKLWQIDPTALAVPLIFNIEPAFFAALDKGIHEQLAAKLSSTHGHQIT